MTRWGAPDRRKRTALEKANGLALALVCSTDDALARLTVDELQRLHGVGRKEAEVALIQARQRRARAAGEVQG